MQLKKELSMWYTLLMVLIGMPGMVVNILALLERYHKRQSDVEVFSIALPTLRTDCWRWP
jgi:hypothetical protein